MRLAIVVALAITLGGCSSEAPVVVGSGAEVAAAAAPAQPSPTTTARSTSASGRGQFADLNTTVWWGRFEIRLGRATFAPSGYGPSGTLTVTAVFTNHTTELAKLDASEVGIETGPDRYPPGLGRLPEVTGGSTRVGTLGFWLPDGFDPDDIKLVFGTADRNQSVVPFDDPTATTTFVPTPVPAQATGRTADVGITLTGGTVAGSSRPNERGKALLRLAFDIAFTGSNPLGKLVDATDFTVTAPRGTMVTGEAVAADDLVMDIVPPQDKRTGLQVTFVVPIKDPGEYVVTYTDQENGNTATLKFTM